MTKEEKKEKARSDFHSYCMNWRHTLMKLCDSNVDFRDSAIFDISLCFLVLSFLLSFNVLVIIFSVSLLANLFSYETAAVSASIKIREVDKYYEDNKIKSEIGKEKELIHSEKFNLITTILNDVALYGSALGLILFVLKVI